MTSTRIDLEQRAGLPLSGAARRLFRSFRRRSGHARSMSPAARRRSSLAGGASTVLEILPPPQRGRIDLDRIMARTDAEAIAEDWRAVGDDLLAASRRTR